jgi:hypothetical protein
MLKIRSLYQPKNKRVGIAPDKRGVLPHSLPKKEEDVFRYDMCTSEKAVAYYQKQRAKYPTYEDFERESINRFLQTTSPEIRANFVCEL